MSTIFLLTLLILQQSDKIQQTSLLWVTHCIDFHLKLQRFSQEHALNPPCFLLDFLILDYYVQSHVNVFLWHLSCTESIMCGFKHTLMYLQVVQFIHLLYFSKWGKVSSQSRNEFFQGQCLFISRGKVQKHHQQCLPLRYTWENVWIYLK